ncbi:hypothetical protein [Paenibacillus tarimensis]|uniref:hypothetical protein n=1 Tax=Paenibacillus tarimensis TaxID=416012 RepID=UPI001F2CA1CB|nr:hypothetical protein [Paenibacillus tarimensis]MCF2944787.1 hypothetical protein [Paenibacillus tarimensis]
MTSNHKQEQAQNSAEHAHCAVMQAEEHPSERMIDQASHSLVHAEAAMHQADEAGSGQSMEATKSQLRKDRNRLEGN